MMLLLVVALFGPSIPVITFVIAIAQWPEIARLTRSLCLVEREKPYVAAAHVLGLGTTAILLRHIVPNIIKQVSLVVLLLLAQAVLLESALSYLGAGPQRPFATWGRIISDGQDYVTTSWWLVTLPGLVIALLVVGVNLLGDGLRDRSGGFEIGLLQQVLAAKEGGMTMGNLLTSRRTADRTHHRRRRHPRRRRRFVLHRRRRNRHDHRRIRVRQVDHRHGHSRPAARRPGGAVGFGAVRGHATSWASPRRWPKVRGRHIALIPQDPMTALSPVHTIGSQLRDAIRHSGVTGKSDRNRPRRRTARAGKDPVPRRSNSQSTRTSCPVACCSGC